jgi:hypothetical protein
VTLLFPKPVRVKKPRKPLRAKKHPTSDADKAHMAWVKQQSCIACGRRPVDVHHPYKPRHLTHQKTLPLCNGKSGDSYPGCHWRRHNRKRSFLAEFGSEADMLARVLAGKGQE